MYNTLKDIERNIKQLKTLHDLGKIPDKKAKTEILKLEKDLKELLKGLPENERESYMKKREYMMFSFTQ
jgi:hypothetical protein